MEMSDCDRNGGAVQLVDREDKPVSIIVKDLVEWVAGWVGILMIIISIMWLCVGVLVLLVFIGELCGLIPEGVEWNNCGSV